MKKLLFGLILTFGMWLIAYSKKESSRSACHEKCVKEIAGDNVEFLSDEYDFILLPIFNFFSE